MVGKCDERMGKCINIFCFVICALNIVVGKQCTNSVLQTAAGCSFTYDIVRNPSCSVLNNYVSCVDALTMTCDLLPIQKSTFENGTIVIGKYCDTGISNQCDLQSVSQCRLNSISDLKQDIYPCSSISSEVACLSQLTTDCKLSRNDQVMSLTSMNNVLQYCSVTDPCYAENLRACSKIAFSGTNNCAYYKRYLKCIEERTSNCTVPLSLLTEIGNNKDLYMKTCEGVAFCSTTEIVECFHVKRTDDYCRNLKEYQACFNRVNSSGCHIPTSLQSNIHDLLDQVEAMCKTATSGTCTTQFAQCFSANSTQDPCLFYRNFQECTAKASSDCEVSQTILKQINDYKTMLDGLCGEGGMCSVEELQGCFKLENLEDPCGLIKQYEECFVRIRSNGCSIGQEFLSQMKELRANLTEVCGTESSNTCSMNKTMQCFMVNQTQDRCAMVWLFQGCLNRLTAQCSLTPMVQSIVDKNKDALNTVCQKSSGQRCVLDDFSRCSKPQNDNTEDYCRRVKEYATCVDGAVSGCNFPSDIKSSLYTNEDREEFDTCGTEGMLLNRGSGLVIFFGLLVLYLLKMMS